MAWHDARFSASTVVVNLRVISSVRQNFLFPMLATRLGVLAASTSSASTLARVARARLFCAEASPVAAALADIRGQLSDAAVAAGLPPSAAPRLVAVSKTKPIELLMEAYDAGQREFGENYVQEIVEKAPLMPADIKWRYIGKLQSRKAKPLVHGVPSLAVVETVDTEKLANKLQAAVTTCEPPRQEPLGVMVQVAASLPTSTETRTAHLSSIRCRAACVCVCARALLLTAIENCAPACFLCR